MKKEELMNIDGMTEELATKIAEQSAEELKGYIPKARFDEVNESKKNAESLVKEREKQLEDIKKSTGDNEELKKQIETLQESNKTAKAEYEANIKKVRRESIDSELLSASGSLNNKATIALMDALDDKLDDDSYRAKRAEQIDALKKGDGTSFLFKADANTPPTVKGATPAGSGNQHPATKKVEDMSYEEFAAYSAEHPEVLNN